VEGHYDTGFITKNGEHLQQCIMRTSERAENFIVFLADELYFRYAVSYMNFHN